MNSLTAEARDSLSGESLHGTRVLEVEEVHVLRDHFRPLAREIRGVLAEAGADVEDPHALAYLDVPDSIGEMVRHDLLVRLVSRFGVERAVLLEPAARSAAWLSPLAR